MSVKEKVMRLFGGASRAPQRCAPPGLDAALARANEAEIALNESSERVIAASLDEINATRNVTMVIEASNEAMQVQRENLHATELMRRMLARMRPGESDGAA